MIFVICRCGTSSRGSIRIYFEQDARVQGLVAKGRDFTEEDKTRLRAIELELLNKVIPGVPRGGRPRPDRAVGVAVLSPDPAAAVRYRHLPAHASELARCRGGASCIRRTRPSSSKRAVRLH